MKECVFWDSEDSKFINWEEVSFTKDKGDDFVIVMKEIDPICSEGRVYDSFDYIGLNDINNNKIYADCSIVEFTYKDLSTSENVVLQGYFTWDDEDLRYEIDILNHSLYVCLNYRINLVVNIKIIDTIQENKLGLIKE